MNVKELIPSVTSVERLRPSEANAVADGPGCFATTTYAGEILTLGSADNVRDSFTNTVSRLNPLVPAHHGQAVFFHWRLASDTGALQRAWVKLFERSEGSAPILDANRSRPT